MSNPAVVIMSGRLIICPTLMLSDCMWALILLAELMVSCEATAEMPMLPASVAIRLSRLHALKFPETEPFT